MDMCKENPMEVDNEDCSKDMNTAIKYIQTYTTELVGLYISKYLLFDDPSAYSEKKIVH